MHKGARALRHGPLFFRFAPTARAMDAALPRPPHGVSVSSALPAQETRLAACSGAYRRTLRPHQPSGGSEGPRGPGRSIVAVGAGRALRSFRSLANIGVLRAGRAQPLYLLTPLGRFGPSAQVSRLLNHSRFPNGRAHGFAAPLRVALRFAQVPTGHTLPFAPQGTRFLPAHLRVALPPSAASAHRAHASLRCPPNAFVSPGFPRSLNRRGGRWPRPPLVSLPRKYRRSARWPRAALVFAHASRSLWAFGPSVPVAQSFALP